MNIDAFRASLDRLETSRVEYMVGRLGEVGLSSSEDQLAAGQRSITELLRTGDPEAIELHEAIDLPSLVLHNELAKKKRDFAFRLEELFLPITGQYGEYSLYDLTDEVLAVASPLATQSEVAFEIIEGSFVKGQYAGSKRLEEFNVGQEVKITELEFTDDDADVLDRAAAQLNEIAGILAAESANRQE